MGQFHLPNQLEDFETNLSEEEEYPTEGIVNNPQLKIEPKKFQKLEDRLINVLVDPSESDYRRRYVKRRIYGE